MAGLVGVIITIILTETQIDKHSEKVMGSLPIGRTIVMLKGNGWFSLLVRKQLLQRRESTNFLHSLFLGLGGNSDS